MAPTDKKAVPAPCENEAPNNPLILRTALVIAVIARAEPFRRTRRGQRSDRCSYTVRPFFRRHLRWSTSSTGDTHAIRRGLSSRL